MLMKRARANKYLNKLHVGVVNVCIGLTLASTGYLGYFGYWYFTQYKPIKQKEQEALLQVGAHDKDIAKTISS